MHMLLIKILHLLINPLVAVAGSVRSSLYNKKLQVKTSEHRTD